MVHICAGTMIGSEEYRSWIYSGERIENSAAVWKPELDEILKSFSCVWSWLFSFSTLSSTASIGESSWAVSCTCFFCSWSFSTSWLLTFWSFIVLDSVATWIPGFEEVFRLFFFFWSYKDEHKTPLFYDDQMSRSLFQSITQILMVGLWWQLGIRPKRRISISKKGWF